MERPWQDRAGRFSPIRAVALAAAILPGLWLAFRFGGDALGPRPITAAIHETGLWAVRFLIASLAITPLRRAGILPRLIIVRRLLGLTALSYAVAHLILYVADLQFDLVRVAQEVVLRFYLLVGFVALAGLSVLGATSTDRAIRAMGRGWHRLHLLAYPLALLALWHFALQRKVDVTEAVLMAGLFLLLMLARGAVRAGLPLAGPAVWAGLAVLAGIGTAGMEAGWYALASGVDPWRVLSANLTFGFRIAPAWPVAGAGLVVAGVLIARGVARAVRLSPSAP